MFTGSERAGKRAAAIQTLLVTAKLNGLNPAEWLVGTLEKLPAWPNSRIDELLPHAPEAIEELLKECGWVVGLEEYDHPMECNHSILPSDYRDRCHVRWRIKPYKGALPFAFIANHSARFLDYFTDLHTLSKLCGIYKYNHLINIYEQAQIKTIRFPVIPGIRPIGVSTTARKADYWQ